ncbi:MAG: vWA domain-containing protein [Pseudomonadota bacterium]
MDVPLGPVLDKPKIESAIRAVGPGGGGIFVDLALETGFKALAKEHVQLKHLLLFSDGNDAEERNNAFSLVSSGKTRGITTSVVALGKGSDVSALEHMSKLGDGRFYLIEDASRLPAVFAQETILAARSSINELSFRPQVASPGPATRGIDFASAPPLKGYVVTLPKGRAQVHLSGPEGDPNPRHLAGGHRPCGGVQQRLQRSLGRSLDRLGRRGSPIWTTGPRSFAPRRQPACAPRSRHLGRRVAPTSQRAR